MVRRVKSMGEFGAFGQAWRRVFRLIGMIEDPTSKALVLPRWGDPETRVDSLSADATQKLVSSGLGVKVAAEKMLGWSPEDIDRAIAAHDSAEERKAARDALANDPLMAALSKQDIQRELLGERIELLARQLQRDLRRQAVIDMRSANGA